MDTTLRAVILPYKLSFVPLELPLIKLKQEFVHGSSKEKKCPIFQNEHHGGIEALFYVEERFHKIAKCMLLWTSAGIEIFNRFEEVLIDTALTNWKDFVTPILDNNYCILYKLDDKSSELSVAYCDSIRPILL
jgi:hypothetical protein